MDLRRVSVGETKVWWTHPLGTFGTPQGDGGTGHGSGKHPLRWSYSVDSISVDTSGM